MPLLFTDGEKQLQNLDYDLIKSDELLKSSALNFVNNSVSVQGSDRCLYVGQREMASVDHEDPFIDIIGSDDATTCHIVLMVDDATLNCSLCHFDGIETEAGLTHMVNSLREMRKKHLPSLPLADSMIQLSIYIVGGFIDEKESSIEITNQIFKYLITSNDVFNLKLCMITELNDTIKDGIHFPIVYGLGYNIKKKVVFMCNQFVDKGPDLSARSAKHFSDNSIMNIYDSTNHRLVIGPFTYKVQSYIKDCLNLPDTVLLKYFSTSPNQEPAYYVSNLKTTFQFMLEHPKPLRSYFVDNKPKVYTKETDGSWKAI